MDPKTKDEAVLRRYLLGELSPKEQEEIDLWLMSDEDAFDLLEAAEDDLIDDSLTGRLSERDLERFQGYFLAAPERRRKLRFSRSFRRFVDGAPQPVTAAALRSPAPRLSLRDILRHQPVFAYAGSALAAILLIGSVWTLFTVAELQQRLNSAADQLALIERDRDDLKRQLDESRALASTLQEQSRALETLVANPKSSFASVLLAVNLTPGLTRSSSQVPRISLTANTSLVRFALALLDDSFPAYRASLLDADSAEIFSRSRLAATPSRDGKAVILTVPAEVLSGGDYSFNLQGIPDTGAPESIARYPFRAARQ